jgi:serine/threonine protein kinase
MTSSRTGNHGLDLTASGLGARLRQQSPENPYAEEQACGELVKAAKEIHDPEALVGTVLGNHRLLKLIHVGPMSWVYRGWHLNLQEDRVVKVLPPGSATKEDIRRCQREFVVAGKLHHDNIVQAYDAGEDGLYYLAMELVQGRDLKKLLLDRTRISETNACEAIRQAAEALSYAHAQGVVHRDIKPSNLMITNSGTVKLLDFGIAHLQHLELALGSTQVGGTPDYMAPEQWRNQNVDHRADLYSLGCTLYALLAGKPPFAHRKTVKEKKQAHFKESPPKLDADVRKGVATIVYKLLEKDPNSRYQTADEVEAALAPFCKGAALQRLLPNRRRALLIGLGFLVAAAAVASWFFIPDPYPEITEIDYANSPREPRLYLVKGRVDPSKRSYLVINPIMSSGCFVGAKLNVGPNGTFSARCFLGEHELDGEPYELYIISSDPDVAPEFEDGKKFDPAPDPHEWSQKGYTRSEPVEKKNDGQHWP